MNQLFFSPIVLSRGKGAALVLRPPIIALLSGLE